MSGENLNEGRSTKKRAILGDISNLPAKRGFSLISGGLGRKSKDGYGKNVISGGGDSGFAKKISGDGDSGFAKQVCLGVENLVKEKCKPTIVADDGNEKGCSNIDAPKENAVSVVSHTPNKPKEITNLVDGAVDSVQRGDAAIQSVGEVSCASSGSLPRKESDDEGRATSTFTPSNTVVQEFVGVSTSDDKVSGASRLASSTCGAVEWSRLPNSDGLSLSEVDGGAKLTDCANVNAGADMLKDCCCSFCLKAAYIWSDLYYQDIKGRQSALRKSQKEAGILVNRYARGKQNDIHGQENSNKSLKLESDLTDQWRSLFRHMEDVFANENSQLQASFITLKDLRDNCKMDLEKAIGKSSDKY